MKKICNQPLLISFKGMSLAAFASTCAFLPWIASAGTTTVSIPVPNNSFESQIAGPPFGVNNNIDSWQKSPKPDWFDESTSGILWTQLTGNFVNTPPTSPDHIDNVDGNQAVYLFAVPTVALFQDYNSTDWNHTMPTHAFNATYEAGKSYQLTVGVIGGGGGMTPGSILQLSLYYRDASNNIVTIAATNIVYTTEAFPTTTHLIDYQVSVPKVKPHDAWAGQKIGIELLSVYGTGPGYWDLDNVRLTSEAPGKGKAKGHDKGDKDGDNDDQGEDN